MEEKKPEQQGGEKNLIVAMAGRACATKKSRF